MWRGSILENRVVTSSTERSTHAGCPGRSTLGCSGKFLGTANGEELEHLRGFRALLNQLDGSILRGRRFSEP